MGHGAKWLAAIRAAGRARRGKPNPAHSLRMKRKWKNKDYQARMKKRSKRHSRLMKKQWSDINIWGKRVDALNSVDTRRKFSASMKKWWATPENKKRMLKVRKDQVTPEEKARLLAMVKKNWADPKIRAKIRKVRKTQSRGNQLRHPQGSFYRTFYKGLKGKFWMRSGWEVAFAEWMDEKGIDWTYEKEKFWLSKGRYYRPDFYLPNQNTYVELKGWVTEDFVRKMQQFKRLYPDVKLEVFEFKHLKNLLKEKKRLADVLPFKKAA